MSERVTAKRPSARQLAGAIAIPFAGFALTVGCSPESRSRVMHFFFEVPPPDTPESANAENTPCTPVPPSIQLPPQRFASVHQPYANNECSACHNVAERMTVNKDPETTCGECHEEYFSDKVGHGPVAAGECLSCHDPHHSPQRGLLIKPVSDMCVECHEKPEDLSQPAHAGEASDCTRCHDAHFGESPLLKPGIPKPSTKGGD